MNIKIKNHYNGKLPFNVEKRINSLLKTVPKKMLFLLDKIIITNTIPHKGKEIVLGRYFPKQSNELPYIVLAIDSIYMDLPRISMIVPFFGKYFLAEVLYHEIGHHYETQYKRLKKKEWEKFAGDVTDYLFRLHYKKSRVVLSPIYAFVNFVKLIQKRISS